MGYSCDDEVPAVLQVHKWGCSGVRLNLSEFSEGFISPTRKLLLLLTNHCEALLLPLSAEENSKSPENSYYRSSLCGDTLASYTEESNLRGNLSGTSGSIETDFKVDSSLKVNKPGSDHFPFISDVDSVAWGVCGGISDQHVETSFEEVLFVSGKRGLTVHAFRRSYKTSESFGPSPEGGTQEGVWVEWGPSTTSFENSESIGAPSIHGEVSEDACAVSIANAKEQISNSLNTEVLEDDSSRSLVPRRWLHSFFAKAETIKYDNNVYTRFPESPLVPPSAMVVSFNIFGCDSILFDFLLHGSPDSCGKQSPQFSVFDHVDIEATDRGPSSSIETGDSSSNPNGGLTNSSFKCFKVFSSNSGSLIGFALKNVDHVPVNTSSSCERRYNKVLLAVARLVRWGLQWVCSVKLERNVDKVLEPEWTDFKFHQNFLICLGASGLISFYVATTAEHVATLDVMQSCGLGSALGSLKPENAFAVSNEYETEDRTYDSSINQTGHCSRKRSFRSLVILSQTLVIGVIDEYGVIYVVHAGDYISEKNHYHHIGRGILLDWEVGSAEISHQRKSTDPVSRTNILPVKNASFSSVGNSDHIKHRDIQEKGFLKVKGVHCGSYLGRLSSVNNQKKLPSSVESRFMRNIFLPGVRSSGYDVICFSAFGITQLVRSRSFSAKRTCKLVHSNLFVNSTVSDDMNHNVHGWEACINEAVGCSFQGFLYLVTKDGISVVLPPLSISSNFFPSEGIGCWQTIPSNDRKNEAEVILEMGRLAKPLSPWKVEILDRTFLYEGPEEADKLCLLNGWNLGISRIRRLQLALAYLKFEEIEDSLDMLVHVNLAEEGILTLLVAATYLMFCKAGNGNEISAASRLLGLATSFVTKMIRRYGLSRYKNNAIDSWSATDPTGLREMARFAEIIRKMQSRLKIKPRSPSLELVDASEAFDFVDKDLPVGDAMILDQLEVSLPLNASNQLGIAAFEMDSSNAGNLALMPIESTDSGPQSDSRNLESSALLVNERNDFVKRLFPVENPKDMILRWQSDNLGLKDVVGDALLSGRLPLAVLKLHLHLLSSLSPESESKDTFSEVRNVGRAISYELFLKGETGLAVTTLQKLGEDVESCLKQLVFGTVRRSLRMQVTEVMKRYGYLGPREWKILESISLIERVYPCSSFWNTYYSQLKDLKGESDGSVLREIKLHILQPLYDDLIISCGEIDGVVLGSWMEVNEQPVPPESDADSSHASYWAAAAVWSNAWDQRLFDRVVLDQAFLMGINISWDSQLEYHICHNGWLEVSKLIEVVPLYALSTGDLNVSLDGSSSATAMLYGHEYSDYNNYIFSLEELESVCMTVTNIRLFKASTMNMCSTWLRMYIEQQLAKKFIFLKDYFESTTEIVSLLARSGFVVDCKDGLFLDESIQQPSDLILPLSNVTIHPDSVQALHKLVISYSAKYQLPNLLDLYLDCHKLCLDHSSFSFIIDAAGDNEWAKWLLLLRVKGKEYEASFSNARAVASHNIVPGHSLASMEVNDILCTVDDISERAGELAALATLIYAPIPVQDCLSSGGVNRHYSSAQCTFENLRPALQNYPRIWRTLVAASFGQDTSRSTSGYKLQGAVLGYSELVDYLSWRENVFFSSARDTSLLQMLPCWFPKNIRRLIQLYVQGPLGWQSLTNLPMEESFIPGMNHGAEISAISWEDATEKHIKRELYASSSEQNGHGLEHHLHRGRAFAAFNHILAARAQNFKSDNKHGDKSWTSAQAQRNVQSDVHLLLGPVTLTEQPLLSSVMPVAIQHFEDSVLVASCAFLLELCGLSPSILQIDVAALRRISSFYQSVDCNNCNSKLSAVGAAFHSASLEGSIAESLARALADDYHHHNFFSYDEQKDHQDEAIGKLPSRTLMLVLQHLEKASIPQLADCVTCGSWLLSGKGDGTELRSQQKADSQNWNLVSVFCQIHEIPLSTKYLVVLARDNDWVGFLSEAQVGGYPLETVIQVASKEFSDSRLKIHILTILRNIQLKKRVSLSSSSDNLETQGELSFLDENQYTPVELFGIIAECEKQKNPGKALLVKAKNMCWSILAILAPCFPDVSAFSCLKVWLEITAARETSAIKVNNIASQIANDVGAAVGATNSLPSSARVITFHYNRRNPKRRRLIEPVGDNMKSNPLEVSAISGHAKIQDIVNREVREDKIIGQKDDSDELAVSLSTMVAVLCEQHLFHPLLRAFEIFLPSCPLLPFIRALQAFSQMCLSETSAHFGSFSLRMKEEPHIMQANIERGQIGSSWISLTAVKAADAILSTCTSPYEKRCLLQLLAATDFCDGGSAASCYRRLYWKINFAEPSLRNDDHRHLGDETLDDASLLTALMKNGYWEQARNWAKQLETIGGSWRSVAHHVTEMQAEAMVDEWKEFLWDVPEERVTLWDHCQTLFLRYSFPPLQAGLFFLKHAEAAEKDLPARELHEMLLLSLQWLSGMITQSNPVYPLNLLREIETRVWLLAVESEAQLKDERELGATKPILEPITDKSSNIVEHTASIVTKIDNHINSTKAKTAEKSDIRENNHTYLRTIQSIDSSSSGTTGGIIKTKRRAKGFMQSRRPLADAPEKSNDAEDSSDPRNFGDDLHTVDESVKMESSFSKWEERVGPGELESAVLSLLEFGQIAAARQLQYKLSTGSIPPEFTLVDAALKLAALSTPNSKVWLSMLDDEVTSVLKSYNLLTDHNVVDTIQVLENLASILTEGRGRGICKRIIAVVRAANMLGLQFSEAFNKLPIELLQLLSLKAQETFEEANLLVQTHSMSASSIAQILAESFLKGLLAAHRGGYMDSQKEEGPAPLLWRFSDFLKWAELCPSEPEMGHALMRLVITGQEIPHACEVELLILSHHFYKSSACLDGVDVLVALAVNRVETYVSEGDFPCLARLITGVGNFHALNFILGILIENGQLDLLLHKFSAAVNANTVSTETIRGFRMAVLTSLKQFNPSDVDALAMVYNHFDMKHETASLLESRAEQSTQQWFVSYDKDQTEDLLDSMRYYIEAAEVYSSIDAGNRTRRACAQASLMSLQIRMPDLQWLNLSETNARRVLVEQSRFQEALIVAEAYGLNQPSEWVLVIWNQMLKPELVEQFVAEFVAVLPLQSSILIELTKFYRSEVAARGDQSQFSVWLTGGGLPAEWAKYLDRSFRSLLRRTRDLRLRLQMAAISTGFADITKACNKAMDKVPENAGPLVLRKGHGGGYLPLM